ncbi:unnamed protein product [Paramecium pentaurelia]|uniref:Uncharacterized protein n=1 Tax=Paramecium pentaurelia TaxID=43138 RepID=A0A8S1X5Z3_9CILI|nr:unnamed protein product [Paramecium pentaurelia]
MGVCLYRDKQLTQYALQAQYTDQLIIDQLHDIRDVINQKIVRSYQYLTLIKNELFQEKLNEKTMNISVIEILGNRNMIYLEIHKQLQYIFIQLRQFQNFINWISYRKRKMLFITENYVSINRVIQLNYCTDLGISENLSDVIKKRFLQRFLCFGVIYINDMVIPIFRKISTRIKCPVLQKYKSPRNDIIYIQIKKIK